MKAELTRGTYQVIFAGTPYLPSVLQLNVYALLRREPAVQAATKERPLTGDP